MAVVFEGKELTDRELNERSNQLAGYLRSRSVCEALWLGVEPDLLVGICVERSLLMAIAVLGTFKAGGAYVPLDPAYPKERLALMLSDTSVPVLLTQQKLGGELPETGARVVCLDSDWEHIAQLSRENQPSGATSDHAGLFLFPATPSRSREF